MAFRSWRRPSRRMVLTSVAAVAMTSVVGGVAYSAGAANPQPAIQTSTPRSEKQVTNIDVLRQQLRNYYGDPLGSGTFADDSNYAKEARSVAAAGSRYLAAQHHTHKTKAILLDVDDTSLATWNYEIFSNWAFNPTTNADYVLNQRFPAVPGMVDLVKKASHEGYAIFFLTGRGAAQEPATLGNLTSDGIGVDAGYPQPTKLSNGEDGLFTKPAVADYPDYLKKACAADPNGSCTTIHYKSATRAHIESLGYDIVANFGDQFSDLKGGFADRTFKLPNPNYYLP
ncbi:HAD family acid phosphatase [Kribbella jiaozuonensis]|uniref:Acid phosphatase n=1 Tax=Kribbella jiaozuonensis TaxID=2575441 RepID=A0A4U3LGD6_9ACTN|nr:HAD family acid phosphatase [Kribbella jiaozuonensis]TKK74500.1 acid phosphatase [Kribbella jiaozuonensis]